MYDNGQGHVKIQLSGPYELTMVWVINVIKYTVRKGLAKVEMSIPYTVILQTSRVFKEK